MRISKEMKITGDKGITFAMVKDTEGKLEEFVAQFGKEELARIVRGEGMCNPM